MTHCCVPILISYRTSSGSAVLPSYRARYTERREVHEFQARANFMIPNVSAPRRVKIVILGQYQDKSYQSLAQDQQYTIHMLIHCGGQFKLFIFTRQKNIYIYILSEIVRCCCRQRRLQVALQKVLPSARSGAPNHHTHPATQYKPNLVDITVI